MCSSDLDPIHGFTVSSAQSPIVFIVGSGCLVGTIRSGSSITFLYCNAGIATKFYCFDLMADNIAGSPFLKTYRDDGVITFNSLQPPLNVVAAIAAPAPPVANDAYGRKLLTYDGGRAQKRRWQAGTTESAMDCIVDITLGTGIEYAVFLPWARSAGIIETNPYQSSSGPVTQYSVSEGAYGRIGGISFMFGAAGGTTEAFPGGSTWSIPVSYTSIPVDRFPVALVIGTAGLPFPYN